MCGTLALFYTGVEDALEMGSRTLQTRPEKITSRLK
jgi:hypothetical protein